MKLTPKTTSAFTLIELLVVISIIGILATLAVPAVQSALVRGQMTGTLSNARQLHLATQTMSLDTFNAGGAGMEWTTTQDAQGNDTPASVAQYFSGLTDNGYLTVNDLKKLITAPGKGPGTNPPAAGNSCFTFFAVNEASPSDQPLMVTANWKGSALTAGSSPYSTKGFVVFTKGGSGGVYSRVTDASSTNVFPTSDGSTGAGQTSATYSYTPLN